jgi:RNA polymerase sigma-70 factor, ECF subfamily
MSRNPSEDEDSSVIVPELHQRSSPAWPLAAARDPEIASEKVFDELFKTHYDGVYRLLYRIVGTREEAEDLAQETFLRLHKADDLWDRQPSSAERSHNIRGWLYRVASNLAYNALRGEKRRQHRQEETARQAIVAGRGEDDPAELVVRADDKQAVRRTLAGLSQQQAQLLLLRHAGLSYRELAEALGVAPGSVGTLLARAEIAFEKSYLKQERLLEGQAGVRPPQGGPHEV